MHEDIFLTKEGIHKLKKELEELKGPARAELAARLRSAIEMGDFPRMLTILKQRKTKDLQKVKFKNWKKPLNE